MTEEFDIDFDYDNPWEDGVNYEDTFDDYRDVDENYCTFSAGWDPDDAIYLIYLEINNNDVIRDYYYVKISYFETTILEIGRSNEILLRIKNSPFDKEYFLLYDGEVINPKSREQFISKIEHLIKLRNFL